MNSIAPVKINGGIYSSFKMAQDNTNNNQDASNNIIQEGPPPVLFNSLKWRQIHPAGAGTLTRAPQHNILENVSLKCGGQRDCAGVDLHGNNINYANVMCLGEGIVYVCMSICLILS